MFPKVNDVLFGNSIRHQIALIRFSSGLVKQTVGMLNRAQLRMLASVSKLDIGDGVFNEARLNGLFGVLRQIASQTAADVADKLDNELENLSKHESEFTAKLLQTSIPKPITGQKAKPKLNVVLTVDTPSPEQVFAAVHSQPFQGRLLKQFYDAFDAVIFDPIAAAIRQGFADGLTTGKIVQTLRGTRAAQFTDGIMQGSRRSIERTVRTAVSHTANTAREQTYKANEELIKGVRWVSTLDTRTSDTCIELDGQVFPVDSGPRPPAHLNCRSTTTPVIKSWKELGFDIEELDAGTRASMDGQVPASMTYNEWLRGQSEAVQNEVLGPGKAALFRSGSLNVQNFVDEAGQAIDLNQLRRIDAVSNLLGNATPNITTAFPFYMNLKPIDDAAKPFAFKIGKGSDVSASFVKEMTEAASSLPAEFMRAAPRSLIWNGEAAISARGVRGAFGTALPLGWYQPKGRTVNFVQSVLMSQGRSFRTTIAHEIGHYYDFEFGNPSMTKMFTDMWKAMNEAFKRTPGGFYHGYAVSSQRELWAATIEHIITPGTVGEKMYGKAFEDQIEKLGVKAYVRDWLVLRGLFKP